MATLHQLYEQDLHDSFGIPDDHGVVAMIPIGYPKGNFGPVRRQPVAEVTYFGLALLSRSLLLLRKRFYILALYSARSM